jgi:hypothetical protein
MGMVAMQPNFCEAGLCGLGSVSIISYSGEYAGDNKFYVGTEWLIYVYGAPNQPVSVHAWQNGKDLGTSQVGQTDASGRFELKGSFDPGTIGNWEEIWYVGGQEAGRIAFRVVDRSSEKIMGTIAPSPSLTMYPSGPNDTEYWSRIMSVNAQWQQQNWDMSVQFANDVVAELQRMGYTVGGLREECLPQAGCTGLYMLGGWIEKDGYRMESSFGNPLRYSSPLSEANSIASVHTSQLNAQRYAGSGSTGSSSSSSGTASSPFTSSSSTTAVSSGSNTSSVPLSATITARDGYVVGRSWEVVVTGPPGQPVSVRAYQDDKDLGQTQYGVIAADGKFRMSGTFTSDTVGRWTEHWYVGDKLAGTVNFVVTKAAAAPQPGETAVTQDRPRGASDSNVNTDSGIKLENRSSISIPGWMLLAGAGVVALAMFSGGGKK